MLNGGWLDVTVVVGVTLLALGLGAVTLRQRTPRGATCAWASVAPVARLWAPTR
jgi:hypothetical protein